MNLIWATRGRTWGFRFLASGGSADPLPVYDAVFKGVGDQREICHRIHGKVALRFPDPSGRKDAAGRVIPHEFVVSGDMADRIDSVERGRQLIWPIVADEFAGLWDQPKPPSSH